MSPGEIKMSIVRSQSVLWRAWASLLGVKVGREVEIVGRPHFRIVRGASIVLGNGVKLFGTKTVNPFIQSTRCSLWTVAEGARLELGEGVGCSGVSLCAAKELLIGEGTILGADCVVMDTDFHLPGPGWSWGFNPVETAKPVRIGRGCFIGARAIILKGVTVGDGAVVGAGAVVRSDVPAGHVATGNPATCRPLAGRWIRPEMNP
jgi:acetyltransferase-like isoleucine patch superfamily enzyme